MASNVILSHYKFNVHKQQTAGLVSAQMTGLVESDAIKGRPENIFVQALSTNTDPIIVASNNPAVAGGPGFELTPGQNMSLPTNNPADWYVVSSAAGQKLNITYQAGFL